MTVMSTKTRAALEYALGRSLGREAPGKMPGPRRASILAAARGFTLVELLIVIAIIAALAVLTLAFVRSSQDKAYQVTAINSMRQVATANVSYATDNNGDINVLLEVSDPRGAGEVVTNSFWGRLMPYLFSGTTSSDQTGLKNEIKLRLDSLFGTPDSNFMTKTFQAGTKIHRDGADLPVPFAFNTHVYESGKYLKIHSFQDPSKILYMSYGFTFFDEADGKSYSPLPKGSTARTNEIDWFSNKTTPFMFLDGHIEILSPPIPDRRFKDPGTTP